MLKTVWYEEFKIRSYEVDYNNRLKISQLFNYMQEAAGNHANHLGWGYRDLIDDNRIWVLSRIKVQMKEYPAWGDTVRIETWPKDTFRLYATRDFIIRNSNDRQIGEATTVWLLLDTKTMRPQRVQSIQELYPENRDRHGLNETLDKITFAGEYQKTFDRDVNYNDIDINLHVNNARYVDWILECFPVSMFSLRQIETLQLNYLSEAKPGNRISLKLAEVPEDSVFYIEGVNKEPMSAVFQAKVELTPQFAPISPSGSL